MKNDWEIESLEGTRKIFVQLFHRLRKWVYRWVADWRSRTALIAEMDSNQFRTVGDQMKQANGTFVNAIVVHKFFSRDFHKCIAAYARQGRQASASASACRGFFVLSAFNMPRSL